MLEQALTTKCCRDIVTMLLEKRSWTIARIARAIGAPMEYVRRIQSGTQSFQMADVEALARATRQPAYRLIFNAVERENLTPHMQGLYDLTLREIESHEAFSRVLNRKTTKKRRARKKAA